MTRPTVIVVGGQLVVKEVIHLGQAQLCHELVDTLEKDTGWSFIVRGANNPHITFIECFIVFLQF
jgi:hypothetical protein